MSPDEKELLRLLTELVEETDGIADEMTFAEIDLGIKVRAALWHARQVCGESTLQSP